jgi:hypothetical protein
VSQKFLAGVAPCGCIWEFADPEVEGAAILAKLEASWESLGLTVTEVTSWVLKRRTALCPHGTIIQSPEDEMPIIVKDTSTDFEPAPEGAWRAVCTDVVELGLIHTQFGDKPMIRIAFELEEINPKNNKPFMVSQRFGVTLSSKGRLRPFLESWRGKKFTDEELKGFDVEALIGVNAQLAVVHNVNDGKTFANIASVMKPARGMEKLSISADYIRVKDREPATNGHADEPQITDDDIPF